MALKIIFDDRLFETVEQLIRGNQETFTVFLCLINLSNVVREEGLIPPTRSGEPLPRQTTRFSLQDQARNSGMGHQSQYTISLPQSSTATGLSSGFGR